MAETTLSSSGSPFWHFSLQFYRLPGVAEACIKLQEEAGADVNLLLFLLWHGAQGRRLSAADIDELERKVAAWRDRAVIPLRAIRRALKPSPGALEPAPGALEPAPGLVEPGAAEAFRTRIKAVELEAERLQQEAMYDLVRAALLGEAVPSVGEAARANVATYARICRADFAAPAVDTLLDALTNARLRFG